MQTDTRLGTFDDVVAGTPAEIEGIARALRAVIETMHPEVVEVPRPGERTSGYGIGPKKMSDTYAYIAPHAAHVNLGFYHGANLADPGSLLEGSGKESRHMKVRSIEEAGRSSVRELLEQSLRERREAAANKD